MGLGKKQRMQQFKKDNLSKFCFYIKVLLSLWRKHLHLKSNLSKEQKYYQLNILIVYIYNNSFILKVLITVV